MVFNLPRECRNFAELRADQATDPKPMLTPEARDIVNRPLYRKLDPAISATFRVNQLKESFD